MAEIPITEKTQRHGSIVVTWEQVTDGDTLEPYEPPSGHDLESVQVEGTFDSETFTLQGSNDGTNFSDFDNPLSAEGIGTPTSNTLKYSGSVSDGTGTTLTDLDIHMFFRSRG